MVDVLPGGVFHGGVGASMSGVVESWRRMFFHKTATVSKSLAIMLFNLSSPFFLRPFAVCAAAAAISGFAPVEAALVTYDINEFVSGLTLSGTFAGQPIVAQSPGSLFDLWDGTITGDLVAGTLTFSGGSSVVALANPSGPFAPGGFGVENYGGQVPAFSAVAAARDMVFDFTAGSVTHGVAAAGTNTVTTLVGRSDYFVAPATSGISSFVGAVALNQSPGIVSIAESAGVETLSLPLSFTYASSNGLVQTFTGTLVATRPVPEPTSALLAAAGVAIVATRRRRSPIKPQRD